MGELIPDMDEKLEAETNLEPVTLETLNIRVESFAEGLNKFYEETRKEVTGKFMASEYRERQKDLIMSQTMQMIQGSITKFAADFEVLVEEISGGDTEKVKELIGKAQTRTKELIQLQQEELQRLIAEQAAKKPIVGDPKDNGNNGFLFTE
jgi:hypothetical protein